MEAASGSRAMMSCSEFSGEARPAWKTERQRLELGFPRQACSEDTSPKEGTEP